LEQFAELTECYVRWSTLVITSTAAEYDLNTAITATDFVRLAKTPIEFWYTDASSNVTVLSGQDDLPHREVKWLDDNTRLAEFVRVDRDAVPDVDLSPRGWRLSISGSGRRRRVARVPR
jgi:hypothetical protein